MGDEVHVWKVSLSVPDEAAARLAGVLNREETSRAERFHFTRDQRRYTLSRAALRIILSRHLHCCPRELVFGYGAYGKPYLTGLPAGHDVRFNLSHCQDLTLIAVSPTRNLGIDVEKVRDITAAPDIAEQYYSVEERQFVQAASSASRHAAFAMIWTRREATAKALGLNLATALSGLTIPVFEHGEVARIDGTHVPRVPSGGFVPRRTGGSGAQWFLQDLSLDPGHAGAICVEGSPCPVVLQDFEAAAAVP